MADNIDVKLTQVGSENYFDIDYDSEGDLVKVQGFDTSLQMSILSQKRASSDEVPVPELRRGWIGNENQDFEIGSKIWLFDQSRRIATTLNDIQAAAADGVQWYLDDDLVDSIEVTTSFTAEGVLLTVAYTVENRPSEIALFELWKFTGSEAA